MHDVIFPAWHPGCKAAGPILSERVAETRATATPLCSSSYMQIGPNLSHKETTGGVKGGIAALSLQIIQLEEIADA